MPDDGVLITVPNKIEIPNSLLNRKYFSSWSGDISGTVNPKRIAVLTDMDVVANYAYKSVQTYGYCYPAESGRTIEYREGWAHGITAEAAWPDALSNLSSATWSEHTSFYTIGSDCEGIGQMGYLEVYRDEITHEVVDAYAAISDIRVKMEIDLSPWYTAFPSEHPKEIELIAMGYPQQDAEIDSVGDVIFDEPSVVFPCCRTGESTRHVNGFGSIYTGKGVAFPTDWQGESSVVVDGYGQYSGTLPIPTLGAFSSIGGGLEYAQGASYGVIAASVVSTTATAFKVLLHGVSEVTTTTTTEP